MKGMKILKGAVALLAISALTAQCSLLGLEEEEDDNTALLLAALALQCNGITGTITADRTISSTSPVNERTLCGTVTVASGVTLTIEAGTTILGTPGSSLFVLQGATINSNGTSANPVVFTSSRADGTRAPGDWGGIVIIGNAPALNADETEGTNPVAYGSGSTPGDNSGTMTYTRIEFAGFEVSQGDELNGLSLYSVGSGTTLNHIQIHMPLDDGIEFFGGRANIAQLLVTGGSDDAFDADNGYVGTWTDIMEYRYPANAGITASSDPRGWEIDGRSSSTACGTCTSVTVQGALMIGEDSLGTSHQANKIREGATVTLSTRPVVFVNYGRTDRALDCDGAGSDHPAAVTFSLGGQQYRTNMTGVNNTGTSTCPTAGSLTTATFTTYVTTEWSSSTPTTAPVFGTAANDTMSENDWYKASWINWKNN